MKTDKEDSSATTVNGGSIAMNPKLPFARSIRWLIHAEQVLATLSLFVILATMAAQVFARYFLGTPFSWSEEVSLLCLLWMTFTAAAFVMAEGKHITVDVLSSRLSQRGKLWLECLSHGIVAGTCLLLLLSTISFVWYVGKIGSPSLGIPRSWWYGAVVAGLLLITVHSILNLLRAILTGRPLVIEMASESAVEEEALHLNLEQAE
ncbi:MAG: TRAP transporter small permease [Planctomyces sp.]|nr:TRAP transporter small permease [Planctomyces sp.]